MLVPEVEARARIGCHARTRVEKSTKRRRLPRTNWSRHLYALGETHLESKLQNPNPRFASTSPIWHNPLARRNPIHHAQVTHCARILGSTQVEGRDPRQNTEGRTVPEENGRLLRMRKFKKGRSSASKIGRSGANASTNCLP